MKKYKDYEFIFTIDFGDKKIEIKGIYADAIVFGLASFTLIGIISTASAIVSVLF